MKKSYSVAEARASLPAIIDEAEAGNEVELTRRGEPVAVVISRSRFERLLAERPGFADVYRVFRERYDLEEIGADRSVFEGLRDPSVGRDVDLRT